MNRIRRWLPLVAALLGRAAAQDTAVAVAEHLLATYVPARDDADATLQGLIRAACAHAGSPASELLAATAIDAVVSAPDPAAARRLLQELAPRAGMHGLLAQRLRELDFQLVRTLAGATVAHGSGDQDLYRDFAKELLVVGPFGDAGDHHVGIVFTPELRFPAIGESLPGRAGTVTPRVVRRLRHQRTVFLPERALVRNGVWYARQRVQATEPSAGFVEVGAPGSWQAFLDGQELTRVEPCTRPGPAWRRVGIRLAPGEHHLVVKTCDAGEHEIAVRWLQADGMPLRLQELPADGAATSPPDGDVLDAATFVDGVAVLEQALDRAQGDDRQLLAVVTAMVAADRRDTDRALELLLPLERDPPARPELLLAMARVFRGLRPLPEEARSASARRLEDRALAALPGAHLTALLTRVRQLGEQDQREAAITALRDAVAQGVAGPETFSTLHDVLRAAEFGAEEIPLARQWAAACPHDTRPRRLLAERAQKAGAAATALDQLLAVARMRTDADTAVTAAFWLALDLRRFDDAREVLALMAAPGDPGTFPALRRLQWQSFVELRAGDAAAATTTLQAIADHPDADAETLRRLAARCLGHGRRDLAVECCRKSLQRQPDDVATAQLLAELEGRASEDPAFARFRRDGDAAIAAFVDGERERTASTTALIDQQIVVLHADGSHSLEVHELRRINDQTGVEQHTNVTDPAQADELLLVRTVTADRQSFVPVRVDDAFALPRVQPGCFVEWRYREHAGAPGAQPLQVTEFFLRSADEPFVLSELVLVRPADARGEIRTRQLPAPDETIDLGDGRQALVWRREHQARLPEERYAPPAVDCLPVVGVGEDAPIAPAARAGRAQMLERTHPTPVVKARAAELFAGVVGDAAKVAAAWTWCQQHLEPGRADSATEALLRGKGSSFLVLVALLRAADVPVVAGTGVGTRDDLAGDGLPLFTASDRFDLPAALVEPRDGPPLWLFLDSPRWFPAGAVAAQRAGAPMLLARPTGVELTRLPLAGELAPFRSLVTGSGTLTERAVRLTARVQLLDVTGYAMAETLRQRKADVQKQFARQICQQLFPEWRVRTGEAEALDPGGQPLVLSATVERAGPQRAGGQWLLPLPLPPGQFAGNFGDRAERTLPMVLPIGMHTEWRLTLDPGEQFDFGEVPAPLLLQHGGLDYSLTFERQGRALVIGRRVRLQPTTILPAAFADWLALLARIDRAETQSLPLTRRS